MISSTPIAAPPALLSADGLVGVIFLVMIGVTIIGGLIACNSERLVRAVAGLIVCFVGVAGLYYFLNSPFVAMMQVLIYVGAVAVTISFAIMLAAPEEQKKIGVSGPLIGPFGFGTAALIAGGFSVLAVRTEWPVIAKINDGSIKKIGIQLLTNYSMVFELISIVLLIAIIGALVIARVERKN
ncbi:MAG: NADH-quinone oxidoreductase subunit J [Desulfobulbaceae bacterium S3730MH12]|nr:MAG: NADH-quinone oxidoreductase subunit J [Desulfobulbaceae bacterium S5133MH15]OEU58609.1 MAG: NADH-quinone oxidoreductase subunit J [Desulfobulbaceae bacterium S3730MH12]OEU84580.1 MAG: NADH-quinone oxidoreductase subunit J [Desulfobulbaceae bacterium C00003063]